MFGENKEKKIVIIAVLVLLAALVLIYIFYFATKGKRISDQADQIAQQQQQQEKEQSVNTWVLNQTWSGLLDDILADSWADSASSWDNQTWTNLTWDELKKKEEEELAFLESDSVAHTWSAILTWTHDSDVQSWKNTDTQTSQQVKTEVKTQEVDTKNIRMLKWTQVYTWKLTILDELGLKYDYILKDVNNVYFVKLSANFGNLDANTRKLWWNTVEIKDKNIINENMLFGDKVIYLNISKYYKQKVFIVAKFDSVNEYWLVQVNFDRYYELKKYLKSLFIF